MMKKYLSILLSAALIFCIFPVGFITEATTGPDSHICDYKEVPPKAATCSEEGHDIIFVCKICGECIPYTPIEKTEHTFLNYPQKAVSCTEDGWSAYKQCTVCGYTEGKTIVEAFGHSFAIKEQKAATCTQDGFIEYYSCSFCGESKDTEIIKGSGKHSFESVKGRNPTCTEDGFSAYEKCTICGIENGKVIIEKLNHDLITDSAEIAPTCSAVGYSAGCHCSRCDYVVEAEQLPVTAHTETVIKGISATCSQEGLTDGLICSVCNTVLLEQAIIEKTEHKLVVQPAKMPTCTEDGNREYSKCENCDYSDLICDGKDYSNVLPATGHKYRTVDGKSASCSEEGFSEYQVCTVCGCANGKNVIPKLKHITVKDEGTPAGCEATGLTDGTHCIDCKEVIVQQELIPAIGHDFRQIGEPIISEDKTIITTIYNCTRCGKEKQESGKYTLPFVPDFCRIYDKYILICPDTDAAEFRKYSMNVSDYSGAPVYGTVKTGDIVIFPDLTVYQVIIRADTDKDGRITVADARQALRFAIKLDKAESNEIAFLSCDIDENNTVTVNEARAILRVAIKLDSAKSLLKTQEATDVQ